jgi:hypothetical protein
MAIALFNQSVPLDRSMDDFQTIINDLIDETSCWKQILSNNRYYQHNTAFFSTWDIDRFDQSTSLDRSMDDSSINHPSINDLIDETVYSWQILSKKDYFQHNTAFISTWNSHRSTRSISTPRSIDGWLLKRHRSTIHRPTA